MNTEYLIKVIDFWNQSVNRDDFYPRELISKIDTRSKEVVDIVGPRRSGKSTLLKLIIRNRLDSEDFLYINFEDPFFIQNREAQVIEALIDTYTEYFEKTLAWVFFDEIQNIENWEKSIRKLRDGTGYKIFLSGSSSKLFSRELSSLLTGRHLSYELLPLNFREYLVFQDFEISDKKTFVLHKTAIEKEFKKYLKTGGFPEIAITKNEELLKQYYHDILDRDIIRRHEIRQKDVLEKMASFLMSNSAKLYSIASLKKTWNISYDLASAYLEYFKEAFLFYELPQFSWSLKSQSKTLKKIYALDTGLANMVSFRFSDDLGRMLENCVFLHLKQMHEEVYYFKTRNHLEVDFLVKSGQSVSELIQVCADMADEKTKAREIKALSEAMEELDLQESTILTATEHDEIKSGGKTIRVMPVYEWVFGF